MNLKEQDTIAWTGLIWLRYGQGLSSDEQSNQLSGSTKR